MSRTPEAQAMLDKLYPYEESLTPIQYTATPTHPPTQQEKPMATPTAIKTGFMDDLEVVDEATVERTEPTYPVAQWLNGNPNMAAAGGIAHTGGIILPIKHLPHDVAIPPGWSSTAVAFASGQSEQVLAAQKGRLAVVRTRFRWFVKRGNDFVFYPRSAYEAGMRGHTQALCAVYGLDMTIVVTFKGKASQAFEQVSKEFGQKVAESVGRLRTGNKHFPRFAFYLKICAGPHIKAGQRGQDHIVTMPTLEVPEVITEDYLSKIYVGRERLLDLQDLWRDSAEWGAAWDRGGTENGDGQPVETEPPADDNW